MKHKRRGFFAGLLMIVVLMAALAIFKSGKAMAPPPASMICLLFGCGQGNAGRMVTVKVEWQEGSRMENVTLKTILRDVR